MDAPRDGGLNLRRGPGTGFGVVIKMRHGARVEKLGSAGDRLRILGPVDAPMARKAGRYRTQLLLQSSDRQTLHKLLSELRPALEEEPSARKVRWSIDVDPIELF